MADRPPLSRALVRRAENTELSLGSLEAITEIRAYLDELERLSIASARAKGATVEDIAEALKLTPQAIYYRFRQEKVNIQTTPGEPNVADPAQEPVVEPALAPESTLAAAVTDAAEDPALLPEPTLPD